MVYKIIYISQCCDRQESSLIIADSMSNALDIAIHVYSSDILSIVPYEMGGAGSDCVGSAPAPAPAVKGGNEKWGGWC
jgi:hypothetical protein